MVIGAKAIREGFLEKVGLFLVLKQELEGTREGISGRGNGMCKGPVVGQSGSIRTCWTKGQVWR